MKRRHIADPEPFSSPHMWSGEEFPASEIQAEPRLQPVFTAFSREGKEGGGEEKSENSTNNVLPWILVKINIPERNVTHFYRLSNPASLNILQKQQNKFKADLKFFLWSIENMLITFLHKIVNFSLVSSAYLELSE